MERYLNLSGASGVSAFEVGPDYIRVLFHGGSAYLYNYASAGQYNIEKMKLLARGGRGLCSFINQNVKHRYARKIR